MAPSPEKRQAFGDRLRALRNEHAWSAARLAELVNTEAGTKYDKASITGWERGEYTPNPEIVEALEVILEADGELTLLLGFRDSARARSRLDRLEEEVKEIRSMVERILADPPRRRGPEPSGEGS